MPVLASAIILIGCASRNDGASNPVNDVEPDPRFKVRPTYATPETYADQIDLEDMPAATRELYEALLTRKLGGAPAMEFQDLLDTAQEITQMDQAIIYKFQMTRFDRPFEQVVQEGVPMMFVMVQKKYCCIYACDVTAPEF
jgi:hypothetical protein